MNPQTHVHSACGLCTSTRSRLRLLCYAEMHVLLTCTITCTQPCCFMRTTIVQARMRCRARSEHKMSAVQPYVNDIIWV